MEKVRWYKDQILALGRAGELVTTTDPRTYALLSKIFGPHGPYRTVLKGFGLGTDNSEDSFLLYLNGKVYSDIQKENEILWHTCMTELRVKNKEVVLESAFCGRLLKCGIKGYLKKSVHDGLIISFAEKHIHRCAEKYTKYAEILATALKKESISEVEFLEAYKNVVYVTYIYELFYTYNNSVKVVSDDKSCLRTYISQNDYLLKFDEAFFEISGRDGLGFNVNFSAKMLAKYRRLSSPKLIPAVLEYPKDCNDPPTLIAESVLQCFKNNMRLKTEILIKLIEEYREM